MSERAAHKGSGANNNMRRVAYYVALLVVCVLCQYSVRVEAVGMGTKADTSTKKEDNITFPEFANVNEANRKEAQQQMQMKLDQHKKTALQTLRAGRTENCDWHTHPFAYLKGEMCGAHYKVLGLDRNVNYDKADIKKAYRQRSLHVHPDKNPSAEAANAFEVLQKAYECLSEDDCYANYNYLLNSMEIEAVEKRTRLKNTVLGAVEGAALTAYFYTVRGADYITSTSSDAWEWLGLYELELFGGYHKLGQYAALGLLLFSPARLLLQVQAVAYAIMQFNSEIARAAAKRGNLF
jgi:hypothetical protein